MGLLRTGWRWWPSLPTAAVSGGGGATVSLLGVGVAAVALFDFADGGASASTPPGGAAAHAGVRR